MSFKKAKRVAAIAAVQASLRSVDSWVVARALSETARGLQDLVHDFKRPGTVAADPWTFPDVAWKELTRIRPQLRSHPLGEATERAVKKTLAEILYQAGLRPERGVSKDEMARELQETLTALQDHRLFHRFLAFFFFEMAIDTIRRGSGGNLYHFTKNQRFVALEAERQWREMLARQCDALALRFVPVLEQSLPEELDGVEKRISDGFSDVFYRRPGRGRTGVRGSGPVTEVSFIGPSMAGSPDADLRLILGRAGGNVSMAVHRRTPSAGVGEEMAAALEEGVASPVLPRVQDLIDLGAAVYMTDLQVSRQPNLGRRLRMEMAVRDPGAWEEARDEVEHTVSLLARDDFRIRFVERPEGGELRLDNDLRGTCVCLFSGGLDSLSGAVRMLQDGQRPLLVSHYANGTLAGIQNKLVDKLTEIYKDRRPDHLGFYVSRAISKERNHPFPLDRQRQRLMPQALRGFLFLSLASAVAIQRNIDTVYMPENGPLALSPTFSEARSTTHPVHPEFLAAFERLIRKVFEVRLCVGNPLLDLTKGEAVSILRKPALADLVGLTNSCWNWARVPRIAGLRDSSVESRTRHDGECLPCIVRRAALHTAGLELHDIAYLNDVSLDSVGADSKLGEKPRTAILDYLRFCRNILAVPDERLLLEYPDFSLAVEGVDPAVLVRTVRRSAEEFLAYFEQAGKRKKGSGRAA